VFLVPAQGIRPESDPRNAELLAILQDKLDVELVPWRARDRGIEDRLKDRAEPGKLLWLPDSLGADCQALIPLARELGYLVVLDKNELEFVRNPIASARRDWNDKRACNQSDAVLASSRQTASRLQKIAPRAPVHVIPDPIDCGAYIESRSLEGDSLLFGGRLDNEASAEGLIWFVREVLPRLRNALGARLPRILVPTCGDSVFPSLARTRRLLEHSGIEVVEWPGRGLAGILPRARVVFVPTRDRSDARFPILEAMAAGRAVIATGQASQGLSFSPSYDLWVADQPDGFASGLLRLLSEGGFREELGIHAAEAVARNHGRARVSELVDDLLGTLVETVSRS
jgi:glycosyltransferase involved in cell wall biosynthesis